MKVKLFSVRDRVAGIFFPPFTAVNEQAAIRTFDLAATGDDRCDDLELYFIGELDDNSGSLSPAADIKRCRTGMESKAVVSSNSEKGE